MLSTVALMTWLSTGSFVRFLSIVADFFTVRLLGGNRGILIIPVQLSPQLLPFPFFVFKLCFYLIQFDVFISERILRRIKLLMEFQNLPV